MFLVNLVLEGPKQGAALCSHLLLKPLMQIARKMADAAEPGPCRRCPTVEDTQDQDPCCESAAHAPRRGRLFPPFHDVERSPSTMEPGGNLRRERLDVQFQHLCDRREDGFASVVTLLSIDIGQPARLFGKGGDPAGRKLRFSGYPILGRHHFSISSS